jgi:two-component system cell cycle response regulator
METINRTRIDQRVNVLSIGQSDDDFEKVGAVLKDMKQTNLVRAKNIDDAQQILEQHRVDLILFEYLICDGNVLDFFKILENNDLNIPVIIISGQESETIDTHIIEAGACDHLPKEIVNKRYLPLSMTNALHRYRLEKEIKEIKEEMEKVTETSVRDELTGLYNRRFFIEVLGREVAKVKRYGAGLALCMMDIDYFKKVNDRYGHLAGDMVLSKIGKLLKGHVRESDFSCRYGGEEFAMVLPNSNLEGAKTMSERFRKLIEGKHFEYDASKFQITVSIGIAEYDNSVDQTLIELIGRADQALYKAKEEGRNRVVCVDT